MKVLILLAIVASAVAVRECPKNSQYNECGTACPLTCDNYQNPPKACVLMCNPGCHCDAGYVKTSDGSCVLPESCHNQAEVCGDNEQYNECGTSCPLTCDNYENPPKICNLMCNAGCECKEGYVKNAKGHCVLPQHCKAVCGANKIYNECGTACPLTCENYKNPPKFCNKMCKIGCECQKGYVKKADGSCVLPKNCAGDQETNCVDAPEEGFCRGYFPSFYFDGKTCKEFVYGGCGGNGNRYGSEEECKSSCGVQSALDRPDCDKAPEVGVCRAMMPRFYYDQQEGMCKKFIYGGCGGNRNNFETEFDCYNKCGALLSVPNSACEQEKVIGPCRAAFPRYHFNKKSGQCELFIYGGCNGNSNNFNSQEDCESVCLV